MTGYYNGMLKIIIIIVIMRYCNDLSRCVRQ